MKFKKIIKTFFIIMSFLLVNVIIDVITGASIPSIIAQVKDGDFLKASGYVIYGVLCGQVVKLAILYFYIKKRDKTFRSKYNRRYISDAKIKDPLTLVGIGIGTIGFGQLLTNLIIKAFAGTEILKSSMDILQNVFNAKGIVDGIVILIVTVIGAPLVEELLFRGVLFEEIRKECSVKTTIFLTALMFGYYHFNIIQTPNTFFMGLVLAYVYFKTKSIKASIIVHATNNILAMIPFLDKGLSPIGICIYTVFLIIGIYSLITLRRKA
ncbi:CPBP family intramembrane glutamic endopeptidase [uncultured Anaerococcus sp.]|uniref:CPBP family intramembrane glutamic endopeptidase n=1 Tax=uncultured Anaerococcus sp. TaxID=293428 RepID=UPI0028899179|nr:CPBP family intramembrane glutamic endopeptidase [uncultured Anaerococcus sp.]